jgi:hypothetical protein
MYRKLLIASAAAAAIAAPAFAQTTVTEEYYVVQDPATKRCTIVNQKPTTTNVVQVGPMAFKTRTEAESGMKTIKVCETR